MLVGRAFCGVDQRPVTKVYAIVVARGNDRRCSAHRFRGAWSGERAPPFSTYSALGGTSTRMRSIRTLVTFAFRWGMVENMRNSKGRSNPKEEAPFEEVMERLQTVVEQLEEGDLPLEQSLAIFEEGVRLSRAGAKRLDEAERRVEELLAAGDELQTNPLEESEAGEA